MTMEALREQILALCSEVSLWEDEEGLWLRVTVEDFKGFDDDWSGIVIDVADELLIEWLETHCDYKEDDFYCSYYFGDIEVILKWASLEI